MVNRKNSASYLPLTIYYLPCCRTSVRLLLVLRVLRGGGVLLGGVLLDGAVLRVLVEDGLDDSLVVFGGLDVSLPPQRAQVVVALLLGALLRDEGAHLPVVEGVVALVDAQDQVALVDLDRVGDAAGREVFGGGLD